MDSIFLIAERAGVTGAECHSCRCVPVPTLTVLLYCVGVGKTLAEAAG